MSHEKYVYSICLTSAFFLLVGWVSGQHVTMKAIMPAVTVSATNISQCLDANRRAQDVIVVADETLALRLNDLGVTTGLMVEVADD